MHKGLFQFSITNMLAVLLIIIIIIGVHATSGASLAEEQKKEKEPLQVAQNLEEKWGSNF